MTKKRRSIVICIFIVMVVSALYYLSTIEVFPTGYNEVIRINSPDKKVDAVMMSGDPGAMSSAFYLVYIVPADTEITKKVIDKNIYQVAFAAERIEGQKIFWEEDNLLVIQYKKANIYKYKNIVYPLKDDFDYKVKIKEIEIQ